MARPILSGAGVWRFRPAFGYGPLGPDADIVTTTRYQAYAEIVVLTDEQAAHEPRAVDAKAVIQTPPPPAIRRLKAFAGFEKRCGFPRRVTLSTL